MESQRRFNDISFAEFLKERKLMGSRCTSCGELFVPPRPLCVKCSGTAMEWVELKGTGRLKAFTCISIGPSFMREEGFTRDRPYCTGVVQLDEGPGMVGRIEGVDAADPAGIVIGMPVQAVYLDRATGDRADTYLAFTPAG
jgi:uncharacterized protein